MPLTQEIAENLYVAISTDTGSFQYPNTTARTFEIAAELTRVGVDVGRVSQLLYENYPRRRIELLRELLGTMRFEGEGRVASFSLSLEMAKRLGVLPEDNEGLIDHLRAIRGVIVAVFFEELPEGQGAREHALENRKGGCVRDLHEIWRRRTHPRGRRARARNARRGRTKSSGGNL